MAQQLATMRTPAAYAGVEKYAHTHDGEAASAAYLALGHAFLLDKRFAEAEGNFKQARQAGDVLAAATVATDDGDRNAIIGRDAHARRSPSWRPR